MRALPPGLIDWNQQVGSASQPPLLPFPFQHDPPLVTLSPPPALTRTQAQEAWQSEVSWALWGEALSPQCLEPLIPLCPDTWWLTGSEPLCPGLLRFPWQKVQVRKVLEDSVGQWTKERNSSDNCMLLGGRFYPGVGGDLYIISLNSIFRNVKTEPQRGSCAQRDSVHVRLTFVFFLLFPLKHLGSFSRYLLSIHYMPDPGIQQWIKQTKHRTLVLLTF